MQCEKYDDKAMSNQPPQNFSIALGARIRIHSEKKTRLTTTNAIQRLIMWAVDRFRSYGR